MNRRIESYRILYHYIGKSQELILSQLTCSVETYSSRVPSWKVSQTQTKEIVDEQNAIFENLRKFYKKQGNKRETDLIRLIQDRRAIYDRDKRNIISKQRYRLERLRQFTPL
jgi:hypothetical protein